MKSVGSIRIAHRADCRGEWSLIPFFPLRDKYKAVRKIEVYHHGYHLFRDNKQEEVIMFTAKVSEKSKSLIFKVTVAIFTFLFVVFLGPGLLNLYSSQVLAKSKGGCKQVAKSAKKPATQRY